MKNNKKALFCVLTAALLFSCGGKKPVSSVTPNSSETPATTETVTSNVPSTSEAPVTSETPVSSETPISSETPVTSEVEATKTISISMFDLTSLEGWTNGTAHPELPTETEDLTITSSGTPVGKYGLNTGKFYCGTDSQTGEAYANWRIYQSESAKVKFESTTKTIKTIKITFEAQKTGTLLLNDTVIESDAVTEINASTAEFTVGNSGTAKNGQIRISAIEVVLE